MTDHRFITSLPDLSRLRLDAKWLSLRFQSRKLERLAGAHLSRFRGGGMDFHEHRAYQPGDDPRHIDWHVTARKGATYTKIFQEEVERPLILLVDQTRNLFFGSQFRFKSVAAAETAALLAWAGLQEQDRVGGLVRGPDKIDSFRPRRSQRQVLRMLQSVESANHALTDNDRQAGDTPPLADALRELLSLAGPGSRCFLVSDWLDLDAESLDLLRACQRHAQLMAIQIYDPMERELPADLLAVTDGQARQLLDLRKAENRERLNRRLQQQQASIPRLFGQIGIPCLPLSTWETPLDQLQRVGPARPGGR